MLAVVAVVSARPTERRRYSLPWNTTSTLGAATNAQYFYDYAGQDPINNYDLSGLCGHWYDLACQAASAYHAVGRGAHWTWGQVKAGAKWVKAHPYETVMIGAGVACFFASGGLATAVCVYGVGLTSAGVDIYHRDRAGEGFDLGGIACAIAEAGAKGSGRVLDKFCSSLAGIPGVTTGARR